MVTFARAAPAERRACDLERNAVDAGQLMQRWKEGEKAVCKKGRAG